ncbi:hypothetical protein [Paraglaciecola sp. L3A3]|uniref:hypothetical protein n=1 Tax=Paraglaciecola sp. L3A3 TaxID=2686358 RepID=UPI00131A7B03|nr:hypothetical protein [Paraglaciecola sp. L3A3]
MNSICNRPEFSSTSFSFVLKDTSKSQYISKAYKQNVYVAPCYMKSPSLQISPNFAHIMWRCGWQNDDNAYDLVLAWVQILKRLDPHYVFIDYAPSAAVAAKLLDIPYLFLGNGFEFPPAESPFPSILHNQKVARKDLLHWYNKVNKTLRVVCKKFSKTIEQFDLKDIFEPQKGLILAHPMLDHYLNRQIQIFYLPTLTQVNSETKNVNNDLFSNKPYLFVYLNANTPNLVESIRMLSAQFRIEGYIPNLNLAQRNALRFIGVSISDVPVPVSNIIAKSQIVICHCGIGVVSHAIDSAVPMVLLPTQTEQSMLAHTLCKLGVAISIPKAASSHQFVNTVNLAIKNREIMQANIRTQSNKYWENRLIWKEGIGTYIKEYF